MKRSLLLLLALSTAFACQSKTDKKSQETAEAVPAKEIKTSLTAQDLSKYKKAYFAAGCFWCVEAIFESVTGVKEVYSGYAGGTEKDPTYRDVGSGRTSHAEAVEIYYDPQEVNFFQLVQVFFGSHDPTTLNRQGPDRGPQYRSIAFYSNEEEQNIILAYMDALRENNVYDRPIVTEVTPLDTFYMAEEYHQDYEKRNPNNPYVQNVSIPRLNRFKENFPDLLKEDAH
ncbi:peptide-methionine (S)-S-oxide reductase [Robiginitalea myxolifaciens]|uniref:Peptide methionine sulfoxide reductase MsrA n=1 Tax=Robiginitalea myxolifaciens TaxID=400055 RepID=A0A1I6H7R2_9FLAO|nr:peptide-methionine (S)-S-oxide reductase MsrA [Robiginitalea myxolifaciens]SFR50391.1 peptide-methionine (S)-S-oxide reductase [Robiginitalea myxolifaciens]